MTETETKTLKNIRKRKMEQTKKNLTQHQTPKYNENTSNNDSDCVSLCFFVFCLPMPSLFSSSNSSPLWPESGTTTLGTPLTCFAITPTFCLHFPHGRHPHPDVKTPPPLRHPRTMSQSIFLTFLRSFHSLFATWLARLFLVTFLVRLACFPFLLG